MDKLPPGLAPLAEYKQFIIYRLQPDLKRPGKNIKKPIDYFSGKVANPLDPEVWTDFKTASDVAGQLGTNHGVGFVLTANDPFFLIDIDGCFIPEGFTETSIKLLVQFQHAATELSSSKNGIHIIGSGTCPPHRSKPSIENKPVDCDIELYTRDRFVALTGNMLGIDDQSRTATVDCTPQLAELVEKYFKPLESLPAATWTSEPRADYYSTNTDEELIQRALNSTSARAVFGGHATFAQLWNNDVETLARVYSNDDSSMDMALAQHLAFWTGCNCERIKTLMLQSSLVRDKWNREDYLRRTILNAVARQTDVLQDKRPEPLIRSDTPDNLVATPALVAGGTFLTAEQQQQHFRGCVYIRDSHTVLIPGGNIVKPDQFKVIYGGYSFKLDNENAKVTTDAWKAFTESQIIRAPHADDSCFYPTRAPGEIVIIEGRRYVNIWFPVPVVRKRGDVSRFLKHVETLLPDKRDQLILLSYLAACVQYPGIKFKWCILLQGIGGNGKTLFSDIIAYCIGTRYAHFPTASYLAREFNDFLYSKIFIGVEEIFIRDVHTEILGIIKVMIDRNRQEVHAKFAKPVMREICCNFLLNSNHKDALRLVEGDRRFAPLFTAQQSVEDLQRVGIVDANGHPTDYFTNIFGWLESGGYAEVAEYLYTFDIPYEFNPAKGCHRAPITSSTYAAIEESKDPVVQEILEAIEQGEVGFRGGWISSTFLNTLLERLKATRRYPLNRRRQLMQSIGYDLHPHLTNGRVNNSVMPDGNKSRLYISKNNKFKDLTSNIEIAKAYTDAQTQI